MGNQVSKWEEQLRGETRLRYRHLPGEQWEDFSAALQQTPTITEVYIFEATLNEAQCKGLASAMSENTNIQKLELMVCTFPEGGLNTIITGVKNNKSIEHVGIYSKSHDFIPTLHAIECRSIRFSTARGYHDHPTCNVTGPRPDRTWVVCCGEHEIPRRDLIAVLCSRLRIQTLESLWSEIQLDDKGVAIISKFVQNSPRLQRLELPGASIGDQGAEVLAKVIETKPSIEVLGLSYNDISNKGATHLLIAICNNISIQEIHLGSNSINPLLLQKIKAALRVNRLRRPKAAREVRQWRLVNRRLKLTCKDVERIVSAFIRTQ